MNNNSKSKMDRRALDRAWDPTFFVTRVPRSQVMAVHIDSIKRDRRKILETHPCPILKIPTLQSPQSPESHVDIFPSPFSTGDTHHLFIYIHGGAWQYISRQYSYFMVPNMNQHGISVGIIGYDLVPKVTIFEMIKQVKDGARCLSQSFFSHLPLSHPLRLSPPSRLCVHICGHSAGGQLAATLLNDSSWFSPMTSPASPPIAVEFSTVFLVSGIFDLTAVLETFFNDGLHLSFSDAEKLSPIRLPFQDPSVVARVKIYVLVAQRDPPVFIQESENFYKYLQKTFPSSPIYFQQFPDLDHFDIIEELKFDNKPFGKFILSTILGKNFPDGKNTQTARL